MVRPAAALITRCVSTWSERSCSRARMPSAAPEAPVMATTIRAGVGSGISGGRVGAPVHGNRAEHSPDERYLTEARAGHSHCEGAGFKEALGGLRQVSIRL